MEIAEMERTEAGRMDNKKSKKTKEKRRKSAKNKVQKVEANDLLLSNGETDMTHWYKSKDPIINKYHDLLNQQAYYDLLKFMSALNPNDYLKQMAHINNISSHELNSAAESAKEVISSDENLSDTIKFMVSKMKEIDKSREVELKHYRDAVDSINSMLNKMEDYKRMLNKVHCENELQKRARGAVVDKLHLIIMKSRDALESSRCGDDIKHDIAQKAFLDISDAINETRITYHGKTYHARSVLERNFQLKQLVMDLIEVIITAGGALINGLKHRGRTGIYGNTFSFFKMKSEFDGLLDLRARSGITRLINEIPSTRGCAAR